MKLPNWTRTLDPWSWVLIAVAAIICLGVAIWVFWLLDAPAREAEARADATFAEGRAEAGKDAVGAVLKNEGKSDAIDDRVKGSEDAVRNTDPAGRDNATLRELCKSASASRRPECAVFKSRP